MIMDNVKVAVRIRPPLDNELQAGHTFEKLQADTTQKQIK